MINDCWNEIGVTGDRSCPELKTYVHCRNCPVHSTAGRELLEREVPLRDRQEQTNRLTQEKEEQAVETTSVGIFRLGGEWLALPAQLFTEVTQTVRIHTLPHRSDDILLGVVSIRGEIQLCISLREFLGLGTPISETISSIVYERMVVVEKEGERWVFPVDEIYGVQRVPLNALQDVPATVAKAPGTYTKAILTWQDKRVNYLDDELLFYTLKRRVL